jgi:hypothetical protein
MRGVRLYTPPNPDEDAGYLDAAGVAHGGDGTQGSASGATSGSIPTQTSTNGSANAPTSGADGDIYTQVEAEAAQASKLDPSVLAAVPDGARVVYLGAGQPDSDGKFVASAPGEPIAPGDVVVLGGSSAYLVTETASILRASRTM